MHYYNSLYYTVASVHLIVNYSSHFPLLHIDYTVFVLIMYGTIDVFIQMLDFKMAYLFGVVCFLT